MRPISTSLFRRFAAGLARLLAAVLAAAWFGMPAAQAADHDAVRRAVEAGRLKPLAEILSAVESKHRGRVLDVELERSAAGRPVYEIKLLEDDGRRRELYIDAMSGAEVKPPSETTMALKPLADVLRGLLASHPGRVLDVELERGIKNRQVYEVRIVGADGRLREVVVDALTGQTLDAEARRLATLESLKPLPDILEIVMARYPGTVREVELEHDRAGRRYYEIDLRLADGRLMEVNIDATSGVILASEPAD
ncbi:MAG TPA: PepSY domain-containing protein [Ideonella sp.]|nr:PepSY domain-containing protein [Ideonella sp.]